MPRVCSEYSATVPVFPPRRWCTQHVGNGGFGPQGASPETEKKIDEEVMQLVADAYNTCKATLSANRDLLDELTDALIESETVDFNELQEMVGKYHPEIADAQRLAMPDAARVMQ